jgi:hypothetical protein
LFVPNGHPGDHSAVAQDGAIGQAMDDFIEIPATGKFGGPPIQPFEEQFAQ